LESSGSSEYWRHALSILLPDADPPGAMGYQAAIAACRHSQHSQLAEGLLQRMQMEKLEPSSISFSTVLGAMAMDSEQWEETLELFERMKNLNIPQTESSYISTLKACNWQDGLMIWQQQQFAHPLTAKFCSSLVSTLDAQWQWAVYLLSQLPSDVDVVLCSTCISSCEKASEWQYALIFFDLVEASPDVVLYNAMISALEKCGQWILALHLFEKMEIESLVPDGITYSAVISACEKGLQWQKALSFLSLARSLSNRIDAITLNSAISSVEKCGLWQIALILLQEMTLFSLADEISFNAAISACEKGQTLAMSGRKGSGKIA